jgi:hypothetical protein
MNIITRTFGFDSDIKIDSSGNQGQINIDLKK